MASIPRPHGAAQLGSGGKLVRPRRTTAPRTPYERPLRLLPNSASQNPNWLSSLILSPTRMIATGAGKVLSSVFGPVSSSSSSSSSGGDFTSDGFFVSIFAEDDADDANDDNVITSQDATKLEKTFEKKNSLRKDTQAIDWKSETKRAIEQLLMQETFSREECDRLTHIIKSRVVDSSITGDLDGRLNEIPGRTVCSDVDMPDIRSTAITEAKKWLEEKKLGSNSKSELVYGTCTLNAAMLPQVMEDEVGSPADLAKSYMQARPPWASPSLSNIQLQSPSPRGIQLFKEETPNLFGGNSAPSSKLIRNSSATGSWNILEEIRKVRSKATEEMLRTRPSSIIDWSTLASESKRSPHSLLSDKAESVSQRAQDGLLTESSPPDIASSIPEQSQGPGAIQIIEGAEGLCDGTKGRLNPGQRLQPSQEMRTAPPCSDDDVDDCKDVDGVCKPLDYTVGGDTKDSTLHETNCSTMAEVAERNVAVAVAANGFPPSGSSLTASLQGEHNSTPSDEQHHTVDSAHDNLTRSAHVGETCEQLSESYVEVPIVNEHEELSQDLSSPNLKNKADKSNDVTVSGKQRGGKRKFARRGRGRVK
ncbi:protein KAKU4 isoform X3 [Hevea brasiliensis]|uniref:protein KAKU4 isoform X3 n=1 Tax=Hevea brasiliensis TaxID=3981 RepID=UPI0025F4CC7F|nr:protein KAKU4 isoform X3 [Hevea brasiliensis]